MHDRSHRPAPSAPAAAPSSDENASHRGSNLPAAYWSHYGIPVQRKGGADAPAADVQAAASLGTSGASGSLPFQQQIQRSFGKHDVGAVKAHTDRAAQAGARAMGASAFASGDRIAFDGAPSLHTAAHEAAHVVQQRGGVQLKDGVGAAGDSHEQHADAVADLVVQGKSAEALLDRAAGGAAPSGGVQRKDDPGKKSEERDREPEDDSGGSSGGGGPPVQRVLDPHDGSRRRIRITDRRAGDYGDTGTVVRVSRNKANTLVVVFDRGSGREYRVHYLDAEYTDPTPEELDTSWQPASSCGAYDSGASARWVTINASPAFFNCTDFAFQDQAELATASSSVVAIRRAALRLGWRDVRDFSDGTVVLYGTGDNYTHAIRRVNGRWEEVTTFGGPHRYYNGTENPPPSTAAGEHAVLIIRKG